MLINKQKRDTIRDHFINYKIDIYHLADVLDLKPSTIRLFIREFEVIKKDHPEKLNDFDFGVGHDKVKQHSPSYKKCYSALWDLVLDEPGPCVFAATVYKKYAIKYPSEYTLHGFYPLFKKWFTEHKEALCAEKMKRKFSPEDITTLKKWRSGSDRRLWQVAVTLMSVYTFHSMHEVSDKIECGRHTMLSWLRLYDKQGLTSLSRPGNKKPISAERRAQIEKSKIEVVHLIKQRPKDFGINKVSWTITDLAFVYGKMRGKIITESTISNYLKDKGVRYKRSREIITSTDPKFEEKYSAIQSILSNLGEKEKFFSIDEYGPKSVRPKGGRMLALPGEQPVYRKVDKSKGWFICTCALELSTNQLTWFYSRHKDTNEMIKLIELLIEQYKNQERLYLSWDAASWHDSAQLRAYLKKINDQEHLQITGHPQILLAPLPAKTPYLNVIESVFSGLSKSVIHNSDYDSAEECKQAVNMYFEKRNRDFLANPMRAGKKIWGKEKAAPVFEKGMLYKKLG